MLEAVDELSVLEWAGDVLISLPQLFPSAVAMLFFQGPDLKAKREKIKRAKNRGRQNHSVEIQSV